MPNNSHGLVRGQVTFPGALVDAATAGELVIFAGAGVSRNPPAGYPDFERLATKLTKHAHQPRRGGEDIDVYLGRIEKAPRLVGEMARQYFLDRPSPATPVHEALVNLFPSQADTRIVTTNYDDLFEKADPELPVWSAPALPRGDDFSGIVHLHGRAADPESQIVITDRDFGEAYLSEGWARDFIIALYQAHPVLFVGYSHSDVVMTYLARGIGAVRHPKYTLVPENEGGVNWKALGVARITYSNPTGRHELLTESLKAWAEYTRRSEIAHERALQTTLSRPPKQASDEERSEIHRALAHPNRVRYVTRHATGLPWLRWMRDEGFLDELMGEGEERDAITEELASWVVRQAESDENDAVRAILTDMGGSMSSDLRWKVAYSLLLKSDLTAYELRRWGPTLLQRPVQAEHLGPLLDQAKSVDIPEVALAALDEVLRPQIQLRRDYFRGVFSELSDEAPTEESDEAHVMTLSDQMLGGEAHSAARWLLSKGNPQVEMRLAEISTAHLARGHDLLRAAGEVWEDGEDAWSYGQKELSPLGDDLNQPDTGRDFLVGLALSSYEKIRQCSPDQARAVLDSWSSSGYPLLVRMALHATMASDDADTILDFISAHPELFRWEGAAEAADAIAANYAEADTDAQDRVAKVLEMGAASEFVFAREAAEAVGIELQEETEQAREPEAAPGGEVRSGSVAELSKTPIPEAVTDIEETLIEEGNAPQRGKARMVADTAIAHPGWATKVASSLADTRQWDSLLWKPLFWGARNAPSGAKRSRDLLIAAQTWPIEVAASERARLVESALWNDEDIDESLVQAAAKMLLKAVQDGAELVAVIPALQQLATVAEQLQVSVGVGEMLAQIKARFESQPVARRAVGKHLLELWEVDREWVENDLPRFFDPSFHSEEAWADDLWAGLFDSDVKFLPPAITSEIIRYLPNRLSALPRGDGQGFGLRPASECDRKMDDLSVPEGKAVTIAVNAALAAQTDPFDEWLGLFMVNAREGLRAWWTARVGGRLRQNSQLAAKVWQTWGRAYVEKRVAGLPLPFSPCEIRQLFDWAASVPASEFDDAVSLLEKAPTPAAPKDEFAKRLTESGLPSSNPDAACRLLTLALRSGASIHYSREEVLDAAKEIAIQKPPSWGPLSDALLLSGIASADDVESWL